MMDNTKHVFKYDEDNYISELLAYVENTYKSHYVGENNIQALDLIFAAGHGEGFCIGDILKYAARYGKKQGHNRKDLLKILHYALLMLHVHDTEHPVVKSANAAVGSTLPSSYTATGLSHSALASRTLRDYD